MLNPIIIGVVLLALLVVAAPASYADAPPAAWVSSDYRAGDFKLMRGKSASDILVSRDDFKVVQIAANELALDIERVTGTKPALRTGTTESLAQAVLVGTLGKSPLIDTLVAAGKLDVSQLRGKWETFLIATVSNPLPNVREGLVIAGSDRRGTAYGIFELSQAIGVSPWYWWADVAPRPKANLFVRSGIRRFGPPSVRYRGIFLNDEDWGLQPWAAKTFEPERGDIGPKTYARIFELLLRLKANTLWPAMHECTRPFNDSPENKRVADDYGVVMGSSHAEPMLRNNVGEWKVDKKLYDYTINSEGVRRYWEERARENGPFENLYTLGMRGIHDSAMQGPKTQPERIKTLEEIFGVQRALLSRHVNPIISEVAQIFCPYKEVLADYRAGLKVPDDVAIVYPDDNFGYIRTFPNEEERKRPGGFGVYYHISYLGRPLSYLWLATTPPALIWEEMSKAYENGAHEFWVLNVGDIKPAEIGTEFFMQMAWDASRWRREQLPEFLREWATREFGRDHAKEIAAIMDEYYRLGFGRKPEHLQWHLPGEPARPSDLTAIDYGDEVQLRLDKYDELMARADRLYSLMPPRVRDGFYELVVYPVRGATLANRRFFGMEKSAVYAAQGRASAIEWARRAKEAGERIAAETAYYNENIAGGKWRHMMSVEMKPGQWPSMRSTPPPAPPSLGQMKISNEARLGVAVEGRLESLGDVEVALPVLGVFTRDTRFIDVFNTGRARARWVARPNHDWIRLSQTGGDLSDDARVRLSIEWDKAPHGENVSGTVEISGAGMRRIVRVPIFNPQTPRATDVQDFIESSGVVSIEAEHFTRKFDRAGAGWEVIPGLGRTGDSVAVFPTFAPSIAPSRITVDAPMLEYRFHLFSTGQVTVKCYLVPTQPLQTGLGLRYAVALDDEPPRVVAAGAGVEVSSGQWAQSVLNSFVAASTTHEVAKAGPHVLRIYMVDAGVVLDKIVVNAGGERPSYLGPPETRVVNRHVPTERQPQIPKRKTRK